MASIPEIPSKINNYNVYNVAERLIGMGDEVTLPDFEALADTISGAGILGEVDDPTVGHFSNMEMEIPFRLVDHEATGHDGHDQGGAADPPGGPADADRGGQHGISVHARGGARQERHPVHGERKSGSSMGSGVTLNLTYILIEVDGESLIELDKLNPTFKVRGVDILQKVREMI